MHPVKKHLHTYTLTSNIHTYIHTHLHSYIHTYIQKHLLISYLYDNLYVSFCGDATHLITRDIVLVNNALVYSIHTHEYVCMYVCMYVKPSAAAWLHNHCRDILNDDRRAGDARVR